MTDRPIDGWCTGCGRPTGDCAGTCVRPLDPPRYCPTCGRRLTVLITPLRTEARCRDHGLLEKPHRSRRV